MMPDVLAVGGVHARANLVGDDFYLEASDYASSFDSLIYPGRHVPDVCGLVGMQPGALYIMLPVPPGSAIDVGGSRRRDRRGTGERDRRTDLGGGRSVMTVPTALHAECFSV